MPKPEFRPGVADDIKALPSVNLQRRALRIALDIAEQTLRGIPLGDHAATGNLSDCYKVYFDETDDRPARCRLVYRQLPRGTVEVSLVEIVAVGLRASMSVYAQAVHRLGRLTE